MSDKHDDDVREEVRQLILAVNRAWVDGKPEELSEYFHDRMVIVPPGFQDRAEGCTCAVDSYKQFIESATMKELRIEDPTVDVWGSTAVVNYRYEIEYDFEGEPRHDIGQDVFVLARDNGKWRAVWRTVVPLDDFE